MIVVRGLDFARHNVILDSGDGATGANDQPSTLPRGETTAKVLAVAGAEVTLDIQGQRVVVESHVALNVGDKLLLKVMGGSAGAVRLSILASGPEGDTLPLLPGEDLSALLNELGFPHDATTQLAASAVLSRDGTLTRPALDRLLADIKQFPGVNAKQINASALLEKANAPVTPSTVGVVMARAFPDAAPQLVARLMTLLPALQTLKNNLNPQAPAAQVLDELLNTLTGLSLSEGQPSAKVAAALKQWINNLTPPQAEAQAMNRQGPGAPASGARGQQVLLTLQEDPLQQQAAPPPSQNPGTTAPGKGGLINRGGALNLASQGPQAPQEASRREQNPALARVERVPLSQPSAARLGITAKALSGTTGDLAMLLEKLGGSLGAEHKELGKQILEAVAEVRYTQLVNGPPQAGSAERLEYLVPLMVPQLSAEHPEGRIQLYYKPSTPGAPIDPHNARLVFVLETEHLKTVQAEVSIKQGVLETTIGLNEGPDRSFVASHLPDLEKSIAALGWQTGRFAARQARHLPPKMRQEEGLDPLVRFDRRV